MTAYDKAYYEKHKDRILEAKAVKYQATREQRLAQAKVYYYANRDKCLAKQKRYYNGDAHEDCLAYQAAYRRLHKDEINEKQNERRRVNKAKAASYGEKLLEQTKGTDKRDSSGSHSGTLPIVASSQKRNGRNNRGKK